MKLSLKNDECDESEYDENWAQACLGENKSGEVTWGSRQKEIKLAQKVILPGCKGFLGFFLLSSTCATYGTNRKQVCYRPLSLTVFRQLCNRSRALRGERPKDPGCVGLELRGTRVQVPTQDLKLLR